MMQKSFLVWDLGATKCAAALIDFDFDTDTFDCVKTTRVLLTDCQNVDELIDRVDAELGIVSSDVDAVCIAAAGRYNGEEIELDAGYPYPMLLRQAAKKRHWRNVAIVHDYVPVVCATFTSYLQAVENTKVIIQGERERFGRRVVFGAGTGLGLKDAVLLPNGDFWLGSNEAGHIGVPFPPKAKSAECARHLDFMDFLRDEPSITMEKLLSGNGLKRMFHFLHGNNHFSAQEISDLIHTPAASDVLDMLAWYLGLFIGTVQLTFMPSGGLWMTGGVILKNISLCEHPALLEGIHASPAYQRDRDKFPLSVMIGPDYALMGCAYYASRRMLVPQSHISLEIGP